MLSIHNICKFQQSYINQVRFLPIAYETLKTRKLIQYSVQALEYDGDMGMLAEECDGCLSRITISSGALRKCWLLS